MNSVVRQTYAAQFEPHVEVLSNHYIWYATRQPFACLTLTFRENADGAFVAHALPIQPRPQHVHRRMRRGDVAQAGLGRASDDVSRRYCEQLFAPDLGGQPLLSNRSSWLKLSRRHQPPLECSQRGADRRRAAHRRLLVGSAHGWRFRTPSLWPRRCGRTRTWSERCALSRTPTVQRSRNSSASLPRATAGTSPFATSWRSIRCRLALRLVMRGGRISPSRLEERSPHLVAAHADWRARTKHRLSDMGH